MTFEWPAEVISQFDAYFDRLLVPENVDLSLNGCRVPPRDAAHSINAALTTEI